MIFLTLGTCPIAFDRLVEAVDRLVSDGSIKDEVFAQIGVCTYKPKHFEYAEMMGKSDFDSIFGKANGIIGHAGVGTILMALEKDKPLLIVPRMKKYQEHVNDHQIATAQHFEKEGSVLVAYTTENFASKVTELASFVPEKRATQAAAISRRIGGFLSEVG